MILPDQVRNHKFKSKITKVDKEFRLESEDLSHDDACARPMRFTGFGALGPPELTGFARPDACPIALKRTKQEQKMREYRLGRYKSVLMAQRDAREYPYHVDIPVPPDGLRKKLDAMSDWLAVYVGADWRQHGAIASGVHVARYMFRTRIQADQFEAAWCSWPSCPR